MEIVITVLSISLVALMVLLIFTLQRKSKAPDGDEVVRTQFQALSQEALSKASEQFLNLAQERLTRQTETNTRELDSKKQLIDQQLSVMSARLEQVSTLVQETETKRAAGFSQLTTQLQAIGQQAANLTASTTTLREALSSSRARGQWGERMAEDILRVIGFTDGINYLKEETIDGVGSRPDFVFLLPGDLKLNMDVKFPFDNYIKYLEEPTESERAKYQNAFLRDVRARIREITTREYIDPEGGTVDYVLLFIPNESVYSFIHENDPDVLDVALQSRVICCSPFTLFAVLAVIRQAVDNFALQKAAEEIISLFGRFNEEWNKFNTSLATLGTRLSSVQRAFEQVTGTRKRMLERPLNRIEALRNQRGIPVSSEAFTEYVEIPESVEEEPLEEELEEEEVISTGGGNS